MPATTPLDSVNKAAFVNRLNQITENSERRWGTMTPARMMAHLNLTLRIVTGEVSAPVENNFLLRYIAGPIAFSGLIPWPRGTGKLKGPPGFFDDGADDLEAERAKLLETINRFLEVTESDPRRVVTHPVLGPQALVKNQKQQGMHFDHHLTQFGV